MPNDAERPAEAVEAAFVIQSPVTGLRIDTDRLMAAVAHHGRKESLRQPFANAVRSDDQGLTTRPVAATGPEMATGADTAAPDRQDTGRHDPAHLQQINLFPRLDPEAQPEAGLTALSMPGAAGQTGMGRPRQRILAIIVACSVMLFMLAFFLGPFTFG
ncbi:MAG: hypothetical protein JJU19_03135 [Pararhodobacter sp.]|nr:hypothetical protein [Pararhodobacter sp.]